jgi:ribosome-associated protein
MSEVHIPTRSSAAAKAKKPSKANARKPAARTRSKTAEKPKARTAAPAKARSKAALSPAQKATETLCKQLGKILDTNKAEDITTLPLRDQCSFADFMIVASGRAPRHVMALADYVTDYLKQHGTPALSVEGKETGDWVLIDAGDIIVHVFRPEVRQFYNIEKMWSIPASAR